MGLLHFPPHLYCSSLYFYCNRPTVAAIISMGLDMGAAASDASGAPEPASAGGEEGEEGACQVEAEPGAAHKAAAVAQGAAEGAAVGLGVEEALDQARGRLGACT